MTDNQRKNEDLMPVVTKESEEKRRQNEILNKEILDMDKKFEGIVKKVALHFDETDSNLDVNFIIPQVQDDFDLEIPEIQSEQDENHDFYQELDQKEIGDNPEFKSDNEKKLKLIQNQSQLKNRPNSNYQANSYQKQRLYSNKVATKRILKTSIADRNTRNSHSQSYQNDKGINIKFEIEHLNLSFI